MTLIYTILITSALFHFGSRARVTQPLWSRYPLALARFMDCAMCSGAWYGLLVTVIALSLGYNYPGLKDQHALVACFFGSAVWTPIVAGIVQRMMLEMGTRQAIVDEMIRRGLYEDGGEIPTGEEVATPMVMTPPPCPQCSKPMVYTLGGNEPYACPTCYASTPGPST